MKGREEGSEEDGNGAMNSQKRRKKKKEGGDLGLSAAPPPSGLEEESPESLDQDTAERPSGAKQGVIGRAGPRNSGVGADREPRRNPTRRCRAENPGRAKEGEEDRKNRKKATLEQSLGPMVEEQQREDARTSGNREINIDPEPGRIGERNIPMLDTAITVESRRECRVDEGCRISARERGTHPESSPTARKGPGRKNTPRDQIKLGEGENGNNSPDTGVNRDDATVLEHEGSRKYSRMELLTILNTLNMCNKTSKKCMCACSLQTVCVSSVKQKKHEVGKEDAPDREAENTTQGWNPSTDYGTGLVLTNLIKSCGISQPYNKPRLTREVPNSTPAWRWSKIKLSRKKFRKKRKLKRERNQSLATTTWELRRNIRIAREQLGEIPEKVSPLLHELANLLLSHEKGRREIGQKIVENIKVCMLRWRRDMPSSDDEEDAEQNRGRMDWNYRLGSQMPIRDQEISADERAQIEQEFEDLTKTMDSVQMDQRKLPRLNLSVAARRVGKDMKFNHLAEAAEANETQMNEAATNVDRCSVYMTEFEKVRSRLCAFEGEGEGWKESKKKLGNLVTIMTNPASFEGNYPIEVQRCVDPTTNNIKLLEVSKALTRIVAEMGEYEELEKNCQKAVFQNLSVGQSITNALVFNLGTYCAGEAFKVTEESIGAQIEGADRPIAPDMGPVPQEVDTLAVLCMGRDDGKSDPLCMSMPLQNAITVKPTDGLFVHCPEEDANFYKWVLKTKQVSTPDQLIAVLRGIYFNDRELFLRVINLKLAEIKGPRTEQIVRWLAYSAQPRDELRSRRKDEHFSEIAAEYIVPLYTSILEEREDLRRAIIWMLKEDMGIDGAPSGMSIVFSDARMVGSGLFKYDSRSKNNDLRPGQNLVGAALSAVIEDFWAEHVGAIDRKKKRGSDTDQKWLEETRALAEQYTAIWDMTAVNRQAAATRVEQQNWMNPGGIGKSLKTNLASQGKFLQREYKKEADSSLATASLSADMDTAEKAEATPKESRTNTPGTHTSRDNAQGEDFQLSSAEKKKIRKKEKRNSSKDSYESDSKRGKGTISQPSNPNRGTGYRGGGRGGWGSRGYYSNQGWLQPYMAPPFPPPPPPPILPTTSPR